MKLFFPHLMEKRIVFPLVRKPSIFTTDKVIYFLKKKIFHLKMFFA